jgi:hypothetical protein
MRACCNNCVAWAMLSSGSLTIKNESCDLHNEFNGGGLIHENCGKVQCIKLAKVAEPGKL